ncbi:MAG: hypothetical protein ACOC5T_08495 [Elusimicrobiota bacterium]
MSDFAHSNSILILQGSKDNPTEYERYNDPAKIRGKALPGCLR